MRLVRRDKSKAYLGAWMAVPKDYINLEGTKQALTVSEKSKYSEYPETIRLWRETEHHLWFPRTFWQASSLPFDVVDCRPRELKRTSIASLIKLDHIRGPNGLHPTGERVQEEAVQAMLDAEGGVLQLACGKGKTVVALEVVARSRVPAIIIVDNTHLLEQWRKEIDRHLDVPGGVGLIQGSKEDWDKDIVLSTYQTLASRADSIPFEVCAHFGVAIWDEGHHLAAKMFAKSADLFYGKRYVLSATAEREDGLSVVYKLHVGPVLYKDLSQVLVPSIYFRWTGMTVDESDPTAKIKDCNGELHYKMMAGHLGSMRDRLRFLMKDIQLALDNDRKVLLLSESKAEVLNLWAMWNLGEGADLYSDIPVPTELDVGETIKPKELTPKERKEIEAQIAKMERVLSSKKATEGKKSLAKGRLVDLNLMMKRHQIHQKIEAEHKRRRKRWIAHVLEQTESRNLPAGVMVHDIKPKKRAELLAYKRVTFAIAKYGKEGLDCQELDTLMVSVPFSSRNSMQQLMGRVLRVLKGKKRPVMVVYEDSISMFQAMCGKLRSLLRSWPSDEGGPYKYHYVEHVFGGANQCQITDALGQ